ncbi:MAG: cupin domain-containing protein [Nanoarchaeota archaeon]|nr:cupin domain-containing protein [Nanoarchaeota archaeon]MBU1704285.1 cupin domain-containing protein [Nanoarchaeota archaeon]
MEKIIVRKPTEKEKEDMEKCGVWDKGVSEFQWEYEIKETCLIISGEVTVTSDSGEAVSFKAGDYVVFPEGLKCTWKITKPVKKYYRFG